MKNFRMIVRAVTISFVFLFLKKTITGYSTLNQGKPIIYVNVTRIVDGDTFIGNKTIRIRLEGINAPELGFRKNWSERYAYEAKNFLENITKNKIVKIEIVGKDKYGRYLAYVWYRGVFVNALLLKEGFAHTFFIGNKNKKYNDYFYKLELGAYKDEKGIWKKSKYFGCLKIIYFRYKFPEKIVVKNVCEKKLNLNGWYIKDEDHHILFFSNITLPSKRSITIYSGNLTSNLSFKEKNVWNDDGDSIFVRDHKGLLVMFHHY